MASIATAEITTSMWGRTGIYMFNYDSGTEKSTVRAYPSWAPTGRVGLTVNGVSDDENMGFMLQMDYSGKKSDDADTLVLDDNAKIWANLGPARLTMGRMKEDDLRGSGAFDDFYWGLGLATRDAMFARFDRTLGMHVDLAMEGLYMAAALDASGVNADLVEDIGDFYSTIQFALGYTIDGVGTIKGQFKGNGFDKNESLNFGFYSDALVEGLIFEIGSTIRPESISDGGINIPVGVRYGMDNLVVRFQAQYINGDGTYDTILNFGLDGMYTMDTIDLGLVTQFLVNIGSSTAVNMNFIPFMGYHLSSAGFLFAGADVWVRTGSSTTFSVGIPVGLQMGL